MVDILVGWHIDIQQDPMLIDYIASALISLHEFWIKDMVFSVDLLKQFLEDMEAYSNVSWLFRGGQKFEKQGGEVANVCCKNEGLIQSEFQNWSLNIIIFM